MTLGEQLQVGMDAPEAGLATGKQELPLDCRKKKHLSKSFNKYYLSSFSPSTFIGIANLVAYVASCIKHNSKSTPLDMV